MRSSSPVLALSRARRGLGAIRPHSPALRIPSAANTSANLLHSHQLCILLGHRCPDLGATLSLLPAHSARCPFSCGRLRHSRAEAHADVMPSTLHRSLHPTLDLELSIQASQRRAPKKVHGPLPFAAPDVSVCLICLPSRTFPRAVPSFNRAGLAT